DQLRDVVEQIIHLGIREVVVFECAGYRVEASGYVTVGLDEKCRHPSGRCVSSDPRQVLIAKIPSAGGPKQLDQSGQSIQIVWLDDPPCALAQLVDGQGIRIHGDLRIHQVWISADSPELADVLGKRRS